MYKKETIKKIIDKAEAKRTELMKLDVGEIKMCISDGNTKIGRVMNVSNMPILSCGNCKECMFLCYDIKACNQYPNTVIDARMRNLVILQRDRDEYFRRIEEKINRRKKNKYFRWHVAGDILDLDYFDRMVGIADRHPEFVFWTYTKMYGIVNEWTCVNYNREIPRNLHIMFSEWRGMPMDNPFHFPEFRVVFKNEAKPDGFYCPGNCDICKKINRGCLAGETTYCNEH